MRRNLALVFLIGWGVLFSGSQYSAAASSPAEVSFKEADIVPGELIVGLKDNIGVQALVYSLPEKTFVLEGHASLKNALNATVVSVPPGEEKKYIAELRKNKAIAFVEPNYRVYAEIVPDDPHYLADQYGPAHIQAESAWDVTTGSNGVILAVIDSGIDFTHPEFSGRITLESYDFVEDDMIPQDECGHGTHVAGIAAAQGNNAEGIAGIAWNVSIMPIRVLGATCRGSMADVAEAMVWAVERGADVINLSLGSASSSTLLENGTYYAYTHGAAIFAAAGNAGTSPVAYPAAYPWVMAVGATDSTDTRASFSNFGSALDVMAPGSGIYSTFPMEGGFLYNEACPHPPFPCGKSTQYDSISGTSMAAPHVAGAAALLAGLPACDTPDKIYKALTSTALDLETPGFDNHTGYGLIQIADALTACPIIVPTPTPTISIKYDIVNSTTCNNLVQYNWRDAKAGGTPWLFEPTSNNGYSDPIISSPFNLNLGGQTYASVRAHSNGYLAMGDNLNRVAENFIIPSIAQPNNFIAPFWDNLTTTKKGVLFTKTLGAAPNREFVVEWTEMQRAGYPGVLQFEIVFFENSDNILVQYHTLTGLGSDGSSATVGLEYENGLAGRQYSFNQPGALTPKLALLYIPYNVGMTPPSAACSSFTAIVDENGGFFDAPPFCALIPKDAVQETATLQIASLQTAPTMPASFLDLHHYADITLTLFPPPPLSPMPEVYVCYHYTSQDVMAAGGHPANLFLTAYDAGQKQWEALPTSVDANQSLLMALAPHLSIYGVATFPRPKELPVTGGIGWALPLGSLVLGIFSIIFLGRLWMRCARNRPF